jgi:hypothetical protein
VFAPAAALALIEGNAAAKNPLANKNAPTLCFKNAISFPYNSKIQKFCA